MPYASPDELNDLLGYEVEPARASLLLELASTLIDEEAGQPIGEERVTDVVDGSGNQWLVVPRWPVAGISEVKILAADGDKTLAESAYRWSRSGWLYRVDDHWPHRPRSVEVTYDAGWEEGSTGYETARLVCLDVAARAAANPQGLESLNADGTSVGFSNPPLVLTSAQRQKVHRLSARRPFR